MTINYATAALSAARRYCGWAVTPPETVTLTVDGPGGRILSLPTLRLTTLSTVVEDGVSLTVADLSVSANCGQVVKKSGECWTDTPGGIVVTMTHGFTTAPDFDAAVEQATTALQGAATREDPAMTSKKVDDVEYQWATGEFGALNEGLLSPYRILPAP